MSHIGLAVHQASQGSNLGPLLFLLSINDITEGVRSSDDIKLFRSIRTVEDPGALQADLDSLVSWSERNSLLFNVE